VDEVTAAPEIPETDSRSKAMSWADWKRWPGCFSKQWRTMRSSAGAIAPAGGKVLRILVEDGGHGFGRGIALEAAPAAEHFVQDAAETEDVGAMIDGTAANLLWGHVTDGAGNLAGTGLGCIDGDAVGGFDVLLGQAELGQAEGIFRCPLRVMKRFSGFKSR
jgi:hypothetical protein